MELLERRGSALMVGKVNMDRNCPDSLREQSAAALLRRDAALAGRLRWQFKKCVAHSDAAFYPFVHRRADARIGRASTGDGLLVQSHLSENHPGN